MTNYLLYIDPGTGSLFFQAILSAILTLSVFGSKLKIFVMHFIRSIRSRKGSEE
ncbi:hypothetical protein HDE69_004384 [Pedobacter cryoconitis]|uniref:Uncharacterized protein n=1 Tax=Pedobacter cryoconitis TaxID=188932 RepID=A0A7W8YWY4_9SPHI|nr:hypothetical protein [Pedobacter cryoconitis]MBB5623300.1 hypothetical protein [Pedobacter cryoconitis]MBB5646727.1 hypothetical protein [Pedobacter cryoconitis]